MILKSVSFEDQMSCTKAKTGPRKCYMQQIENYFSKTSTFKKESTCTVEQNKQRLKKQQATLFDILKKKRVALFFFKSKSLVI